MTPGRTATVGTDDYSAPPVVETVLGIEFSPLPDFGFVSVARTHELWAHEYPHIMEQTALPPSRPAAQGAGFELQFGVDAPAPRLWAIAEDQHELVQVQRDRLVLNWRRLDAFPSSYPGFDPLMATYEGLLSRFIGHLGDSLTLQPLVVEWTYVNSIEPKQMAEADAFTMWSDPKFGLNETPIQTRFHHTSEFAAADAAQGQVDVRAEPAAPGPGSSIQMTVSCKIFLPAESATDTALRYCHEAHKVARQAFEATTTPEAKASWGGAS